VVVKGVVLLVLLKSCTAPWRNPGATGVNVTLTVQVAGAVTVPVQVLPLASEKSSPCTPCVATWGVPKVVLVVTL
jgi:hypothetical protein